MADTALRDHYGGILLGLFAAFSIIVLVVGCGCCCGRKKKKPAKNGLEAKKADGSSKGVKSVSVKTKSGGSTTQPTHAEVETAAELAQVTKEAETGQTATILKSVQPPKQIVKKSKSPASGITKSKEASKMPQYVHVADAVRKTPKKRPMAKYATVDPSTPKYRTMYGVKIDMEPTGIVYQKQGVPGAVMLSSKDPGDVDEEEEEEEEHEEEASPPPKTAASPYKTAEIGNKSPYIDLTNPAASKGAGNYISMGTLGVIKGAGNYASMGTPSVIKGPGKYLDLTTPVPVKGAGNYVNLPAPATKGPGSYISMQPTAKAAKGAGYISLAGTVKTTDYISMGPPVIRQSMTASVGKISTKDGPGVTALMIPQRRKKGHDRGQEKKRPTA